MARDQELEIWENPTQSMVSIFKLDHRGVPYDVVVSPKRKVNLTPEEREMCEGMTASEELNPFRNGLLRPLKLVDNPDATVAVVTANAQSDDDLAGLLSKGAAVFNKALKDITSPITMRRLLSVAKEVDASVKQVDAINVRLIELDPSLAAMQVREIVESDADAKNRRS